MKVGIIGCGRVAEERHLPVLQSVPGVEVAAAADLDPARLERIAGRFHIPQRFGGYRELLERSGVDAVAVLTPTASHAEIGMAALDAGKHLLIEKPLAMTPAECDELITRRSRSSCKAAVCFHFRWHRLVRSARELIRSGALGRIHAVRSVFTHNRSGRDAPPWHRKRETGGGVSFNEAVHHFDLWRHLLDTEMTRVFSASVPSAFYDDETTALTACLANGALATGVFALRSGANCELEIYGEAGRLYLCCDRFDGLEFFPASMYAGNIGHRLKKAASSLSQLPGALRLMRRGGLYMEAFHELWSDFARSIRNDQAPGATLEDGKRSVLAALAAANSASSGLPVAVD
jgi:predicted dehydrogenase